MYNIKNNYFMVHLLCGKRSKKVHKIIWSSAHELICFQIIKMLTEKSRNQEAMIEEFELREQEYQEMMSETDILKQQNESMK